jgi:hypothetical protein
MVHAAMSKVGRLLNGPDALIGALLDAAGPFVRQDTDGAVRNFDGAQGRLKSRMTGIEPGAKTAVARVSFNATPGNPKLLKRQPRRQ